MDAERFEWIMGGLRDDLLNDWERKFIDDITRKWEKYGRLTEAQEDKLEEIFKENTR